MAVPSLPALSFGSLTITLAGTLISNILDGIYDALSATTYDDGVSVPTAARWVATKHQNAGVTESVTAVPAASSPIAGKVVLMWAGAVAGTHASVVMASPDVYANTLLNFGAYVANAGSTVAEANYSAWDAATPFSGGTGRWSGYCRVTGSASAAKVFLFTSTDYVGTQVEEALGPIYACAGGFGIRGLTDGTTNSESGLGGRVFDFGTTSSALALAATFWTVNIAASGGGLLAHSTSASASHWWYLAPGSATIRPVSYRAAGGAAPDGYQLSSSLACVGLDNSVEPETIALRDVGVGGNTGKKIGRHRAFFYAPKHRTKAILSAGATKAWVAFGNSSTVDNDCALMPR